jgi:glutaconate CoA-transferase subunit B
VTDPADSITVLLARDVVDAVGSRGLRVFAITSPVSMVAGLLAQRIGAPTLALAGGFGRLDVDPRPAVTSGEFALGLDASPHAMSAETFMALARGKVGVVVSPAQIDARAALNLSGVGGSHAQPAVALPGSRGLPDNNHSISTVWYFVPEMTPRRLVAEVDFVSGSAPPAGIRRLLLSPTATLSFDAASGWRIVGLAEGVTVEDVRAAAGFELAADSPPVHVAPSPDELAALAAVDPHGLRRLDFGSMPGAELGAVMAEEARELADALAHS